jgi:hypothetical protein
VKLFYEEAKGKGETPVDLGVTVAANTKFTYELGLSQGV